jgi:hypothetical protein
LTFPLVTAWLTKDRPGAVGIFPRRHAAAGRKESNPAAAEGSSQTQQVTRAFLPCSSPITSSGKSRRLRGLKRDFSPSVSPGGGTASRRRR